jgi:sec-independent protein translocase protein TatC
MRKNQKIAAKRTAQKRLHRQAYLPQKKTFLSHVQELRRCFFWLIFAIGLGTAGAYAIQDQLIRWLVQPAGNQHFIYTTPGGGIDFQLMLCLSAGIALSVPFIIYHITRYLQPLLADPSLRKVRGVIFASGCLAGIGISFAYFIGLPPAMHFLLQSFADEKITALLTIQSYLSFVVLYLLGAAFLLQLPLVLLIINRFHPIPPRTLLRQQRWWIVGALIAGAVISPTADIGNQLLLSGPIILMYEVSIALVWLNRPREKARPPQLLELLDQDQKRQAERQATLHKALAWQRQKRFAQQPNLRPVIKSAASSLPARPAVSTPSAHTPPAGTAGPIPSAPQSSPSGPITSSQRAPRRGRYIQDFTRRPIMTVRSASSIAPALDSRM